MSGALALTEDQAKVIARLKVGQAIVAGIQDDMASWVKVAYTPMQKLSPSPQPLSPRERG